MNLNLFDTLKNEIKSNKGIQKFINEIGEILQKNQNDNKNTGNIIPKKTQNTDLQQDTEALAQYRKEGHLYLVTEDRNGQIFLWDMTDRPKNEIEEVDFPDELVSKATEGSVFVYKNGTYEFYSEDGYNILFNN